MFKALNKITIALSLVLISSLGLAQNKEIKVKFLGNCGLYMTDGDLHIFSDFPYESGAYGYMEYNKSELDSIPENSIFIFTHSHKDHYSRKDFRKVLKEKGGKKYNAWNIRALKKIGENNPNFNIQVFKTKHRFTIRHYSYLITWHGKRIFLSGDTEGAETFQTVKDIDYAFIPSWVLFYAKRDSIEIDAKMKMIYHLRQNEKGKNTEDRIYLSQQNYVMRIPYSNGEAIKQRSLKF